MNPPISDPIESFRSACNEAERVSAMQGTADAADALVADIRTQIETCDDEAAAAKLGKRLADAEIAARVANIRAQKADSAWQTAATLARPALEATTAQVADACGNSFDLSVEIFRSLLAPEAAAHARNNSFEHVRIADASNDLAGSGLACASANLIQDNLRNALRGYSFQDRSDYCRVAIAAITRADELIPEIQRQAALLSNIHAAVTGALRN